MSKKEPQTQNDSHHQLTNEELVECAALKNIWRQSNLTQAEFAAQLGLSRSQVGRMIRKERPCGPKVRTALAQYQRAHASSVLAEPCSGVTECVIRDVLRYELEPLVGEMAQTLAAKLATVLAELLCDSGLQSLTKAQSISYLELVRSQLCALCNEKQEITSSLQRGAAIDSGVVLTSNWRDALVAEPRDTENDDGEGLEQQSLWSNGLTPAQ